MAIFEWNDTFSVGIPTVDEQHKKLVRMINRLDYALVHGHEVKAIGDLYQEIAEYTVYHFSTEEKLMTEGRCQAAHIAMHKAAHADFIKSVQALSDSVSSADSKMAESVLDFLIQWLIHHILGKDKEMAGQIGSASEEEAGEAAVSEQNPESTGEHALVAERSLLAALRESEKRFRTLADDVPVLIWASDREFGRGFFNKTWLDFTGRPVQDEAGEGWMDGIHPEDLPQLEQSYSDALAARQRYNIEYRLQRADQVYRWMFETGVPRNRTDGEFAGFVGACIDITAHKDADAKIRQLNRDLEQRVVERTAELSQVNHTLTAEVAEHRATQAALLKEKEEQRALIAKLEAAQNQLLQAEKMAAIGQLAAGVAHEINNPIGYVRSNLGSLKIYIENLLRLVEAYERAASKLPPECEDLGPLESLKREVDIDYLREDAPSLLEESEEGVARVAQIVKDLKDFSHVDEAEWQWADLNKGLDSTLNVARNEIKYKAEVVKHYADIPQVHCLPQQLNQVFMNLLVNAAQAIDKQGTITIATGVDKDEVTIDITDTGGGIAPDHLKRIFDPFFTTKPVGKGTGLGLSLAHSIISKHKGRIRVSSTIGQGTTFHITLPVDPAPEVISEPSVV